MKTQLQGTQGKIDLSQNLLMGTKGKRAIRSNLYVIGVCKMINKMMEQNYNIKNKIHENFLGNKRSESTY